MSGGAGEGTILFGGSGHIGSAILERAPAMVSVGRTAPAAPNRHVHVEDVGDLSQLTGERFRTVVYAIGAADRRQLEAERIPRGARSAYDYHLTPLLQVLEQLRGRRIDRFVHISTVLLYDETRAQLPYAEDAAVAPLRSRHVFAKHLAEESLRFYGRWIPYVNVRLANTYGPSRAARPDLIGGLCRQLIAQGTARMLTTEGERDFVHVDDAARAVVALLDAGHVGTVNVGTGVRTPVARVRDILEAVSGGRIEVLGAQADGPHAVQCDIGLLRRLTGWEPRYGILDGLRETYRRMREMALSP
jgi:UDP-glucose 4-epimerase